jgi:hypothetical protein
MAYKVAAIDIHKMVLIVAVATAPDEVKDATGEALEFECRRFGAAAQERMHLLAWLQERNVQAVVMESTAQYWKPVWLDLEPHFPKLHLAQAHSNKAPKGRKDDYKDATRLARRLLAGELMLSFVSGGGTTHLARTGAGQRAVRAGTGARAKPDGEPSGGNADQAFRSNQRSAGSERASHSDGAGGG